MTRLARLLAAALLAVTAINAPARAQQGQPVLFFAAASLQTALNAIATKWQAETGKSVTFSYAASSALGRQMEAGAPADLFASADLEWMDWAEQKKLIKTDSRKTLLGNALVLIAPKDSTASLSIAPGFKLAEAIGDSRLATGNPGSVPVGKYAKTALTNLGVWDKVEPKIAGADSVRAALALVARGEAAFGIVYATDAKVVPRVKVIATFPENTHPPVVYPFALTASSTHPDAPAFLAYLTSPTAKAIFEGEGFTVMK